MTVFFDTFGGAAIGASTDTDPIFVAHFRDTAEPFNSNDRLRFNFSLDDSSGDWKVVSGATRATVTNRSVSSNYTINAVPIPAAAWLFTSGLIGLIGFARRKA